MNDGLMISQRRGKAYEKHRKKINYNIFKIFFDLVDLFSIFLSFLHNESFLKINNIYFYLMLNNIQKITFLFSFNKTIFLNLIYNLISITIYSHKSYKSYN